MTEGDNSSASTPPDAVDGRAARRQSNIDTVLDVVVEMLAEEAMFPTIEQAATRSGLSLRSLYRYFADPAELIEAAISRSNQVGRESSRLHAIGEGSLATRVENFVTMRLHVHDLHGPGYRATLANAVRHDRLREELTKSRQQMTTQFELQFAPELGPLTAQDRARVVAAGDLLTQLESVDYLRRHRNLSRSEAHDALTSALHAILT